MNDQELDTNHGDRTALACVQAVAVCLGAACGLHLAGIAGVYRAILDPLPQTLAIVMAVALLAAAIGAWLPQRLVVRRLRLAGGGAFVSTDLVGVGLLPHTLTQTQQGLLWVILAATCLIAGALGLLLLWASGPIELAHRWMSERFFLGTAELIAVDLIAVSAGVGCPWLVIGLALTCLNALFASYKAPGQAGSGTIGSALVGASIGLAVGSSAPLLVSPGRTVLIASLPLFAAAVTCVVRAGRRQSFDSPARQPELQLPQCASEAGHALLATVGVWGFLVGSTFSVWPRVIATGIPVMPEMARFSVAWMLVCLGVGILVGDKLAGRRERPAGGCGPAVATSGFGVGLAIAACAVAGYLVQLADPPDSRLLTAMVMIGQAIGASTAGVAFSYLKRALIVQAGSPTAAWSMVAIAGLVGVCLGVVASLCWIVSAAGSLVALAAGGLVAIAGGGLLVIFDVGGPTRRHRLHLVGVFAALVVLMVGLPKIRTVWLSRHGGRDLIREGSWLTASLTDEPNQAGVVFEPHPTTPPPIEGHVESMRTALRAVMRLRGPMDRCLMISAGELRLDKADKLICRSVDRLDYDPLDVRLFAGSPADSGDGEPASRDSRPALRAIRAMRGRYDLVVLASVPNGHPANAAIWSIETLQRAMRRLAPKGMLAGLVIPRDCGRIELATIAATFASAVGTNARAGLIGKGNRQVLALLGSTSRYPRWDWPSAAQVGMHHAGPLASLLEDVGGEVRPNSLRSLRLIRDGNLGNGGSQLAEHMRGRTDWRRLRPGKRPVPVWPPSPTSKKVIDKVL